MTGDSPNGDISAEYAALQRLAGAPGTASVGSGLPAVVTSLTSLQKDCSTPLKFAEQVHFPDARQFEAFYTAALEELVGPKPDAGMQLLVTHVTALADVAKWTVENYKSARDLENAGASAINDRLNQALANPGATTNGSGPAGPYPQGQNPAPQNSTGATQ